MKLVNRSVEIKLITTSVSKVNFHAVSCNKETSTRITPSNTKCLGNRGLRKHLPLGTKLPYKTRDDDVDKSPHINVVTQLTVACSKVYFMPYCHVITVCDRLDKLCVSLLLLLNLHVTGTFGRISCLDIYRRHINMRVNIKVLSFM